MFVITPTDKLVNLGQYAIVEIRSYIDMRCIYALSRDEKNEVELASWTGIADKAELAYQKLITSLEQGHHVFDIRPYVLPDEVPKKRPIDPLKKLPKDLIVTIDDENVIEGIQWRVFVAAIERAGPGKVLPLELGSGNKPLIKLKNTDELPEGGYRSDKSGHYAIYTNYSAEDKKDLLDDIANKLPNLQWYVEIVENERK